MCDDGIDYDGMDWDDWMIIGPMSEELARERLEQERLERDLYQDDGFDPGEEF